MTKADFQRKHLAEFSRFMGSEMGKDLMTYLQAQRPRLGWYKEGKEQTEYMNVIAAGHEFCMLKMTDAMQVGRLHEEVEATYGVSEKEDAAKDAKKE